jgi:hypothetical protein
VSDLQTAYYIIGIVFMGLMLLLGLVTLIAVLVIRSKVVAIHQRIDERLTNIMNWAEKGNAVFETLKGVKSKTKK